MKVGITMDLESLESLAREYITDMGGDGNNDISERLTLSSFIAWLRQRQAEKYGNVLTFRVEKGAG